MSYSYTYQRLKPNISEETFEYLPLMAQITSYSNTESSCFGFFYLNIDVSIAVVGIPEYIPLSITIHEDSCLATVIPVTTIHLEPKPNHIESVKGFKVPAGWYQRHYRLMASVDGLKTRRTLLEFTVTPTAQVTYRNSNYLKNVRALLNARDIRTWETALCLHLNLPITHDGILNRSGLHTLMSFYYLNHNKPVKKELTPILSYFFKLIGYDDSEYDMFIICSRITNMRYSSSHLIYDLINEMSTALSYGKISISSLVQVLTSINQLHL